MTDNTDESEPLVYELDIPKIELDTADIESRTIEDLGGKAINLNPNPGFPDLNKAKVLAQLFPSDPYVRVKVTGLWTVWKIKALARPVGALICAQRSCYEAGTRTACSLSTAT